VDRLIAPSAHCLASSGIGSARSQFGCSPCLANLSMPRLPRWRRRA
jgi:hypothetical protein